MLTTELDATDWQILALLQEDARISNVDLAKAVGRSPSPCLARVRALEEAGFIRRYVSLLDPQRVGLMVSVFIQVALEKQVESALEVFERAIRDRPEVMECYLLTGESDYLLRVVVPDLEALERTAGSVADGFVEGSCLGKKRFASAMDRRGSRSRRCILRIIRRIDFAIA